jgi:TP901 family phage tail tape measure protein
MNSNQQRYDLIIGMQARELVNGVKASKKSLDSIKQTFKDTLDVLNTSPKQYGFTDTKQIIAARKEVEKLIREVEKLQATGKKTLAGGGAKANQATARQSAQLMGGVASAQQTIQAATPSAILKQQEREQARAVSAQQKMQNKAITLRYALYDVGSAAQSAADAFLRFSGATLQAATAQEAAFSQIQKTLVGEASTAELEKLKNELIDLSTEIPVTFEELAKIGMLGSQLGIAADDIASFTEVTAKFSAITGMSVDETAMAFGKIANILGLSADQYEALGSAIAGVGVKTAATEQQIISTAGQIGAVASAAGFTASQVIGLSASFASLRIAPEEARGVVIRTFSEMSQAVNSFNKNNDMGGERLKAFANIAGLTSKEFAEGWGSKGDGAFAVFEQFILGLSKGDIPKELQRIGLDGVRTSKGLTALANGFDSVFGEGGAIEIARTAGAEGTFLDESFATIVEDLSSKLKMLQNSFENLAAAAGGGGLLRVLSQGAEVLTMLNTALTDFLSSPIVQPIANIVVAFAAIAGIATTVAAALAIAAGGALAIRTAFLAASADGIIFKGSLLGLFAQLIGIDVAAKPAAASIATVGASSKGAAVGVNALTTSMKLARLAFMATGFGLVAIAALELITHFSNMPDEAEGAARGLDEVQQGLSEVMKQTSATTQEMVDFMNQALEPVKNLVSLENSLYSLGGALSESATDFDVYSEAGRNNINALMATISAITLQAAGDQQLIADNLNALMQYMIQSGLGVEYAFDIIRNAIAVTGLEAGESVMKFDSVAKGMGRVSKSAGRAETALEKMTKAFVAAFENLDATANIEGLIDDFGKSLVDNGKRVDTFSQDGRANFSSLRDVIFGLKDTLSGNPQSLANTLASLREAMVRVGITSAVAFDQVNAAMKATGKTGIATSEVINALVGSITQAGEEAKELRTVADYVSDLSSVLSGALENRYARQDARDSISSAWNTIAESAQEAREAIDEANNSIRNMQATRGVLEYQLRVAVRYGDTLRADAIRARLSDVDSEIIKKREELAEAQKETTRTLVGNSKSAIDNRAAVVDLVGSYNDYLTSLALSGASSDELKAEAERVSEEFLNQGVNLGFAREELIQYTDAFKKDFTTVIDNLPKNITLNIVTDPALAQVVQFVKDANAELAKLLSGTPSVSQPAISLPGVPVNTGSGLSSGGGGGGGGGGSTGAGTKAEQTATINSQLSSLRTTAATQAATIRDLQTQLTSEQATARFGGNPTVRNAAASRASTIQSRLSAAKTAREGTVSSIEELERQLRALNPRDPRVSTPGMQTAFARGGFVRGPGSGTSDSINARLSNGEYVLRANAVKYYGTDFMNSLNQMQVQAAPSGGGNGVVYLSPEDRALLRSAIDRPISLYTENTKIASSANAGNVVLAQRGAR